jgi:uncharacterized repeat protein (TIGR04052 family)
MHRLAIAVLAVSFLAACGDDKKDPVATDRAVTIHFKAVVNAVDFACTSGGANTSYALGTAGSAFEPRDLRFYVHDVQLILHDGSTVPFQMADDGNWQRNGVALLDFEDGTGACATDGDAARHTSITGRAPNEHIHAVRFLVGVPEAMNHLEAATATAPLNRTKLFWSWTGGYKHMKIDGNVTSVAAPNLHNFHLGSTGCALLDPADQTKGAFCNTSNRPAVLLDMDPDVNTAVLDLAELFATANLDSTGTGPGNAPGCMSGAADAECGPIFAKLGLPWGTAAPGVQGAFGVQ